MSFTLLPVLPLLLLLHRSSVFDHRVAVAVEVATAYEYSLAG